MQRRIANQASSHYGNGGFNKAAEGSLYGSRRHAGSSMLALCSRADVVATALAASALVAGATDRPPDTALSGINFQKPAWLTDLSLTVKEGYDDNVFLSEAGPTKDLGSWFTTVAPKMGVNFAPLLGDQKDLSVLSLGYAPEFNIYTDQTGESYDAHRVATTIQGKTAAVSYSLENGFNYIDGSKDSPIYLQGKSAYATAVPRERREQFQDRAKIVLQYDQERWFIRPTAAVLYYDLHTNLRAPTGEWRGYDNYCDRSDVSGGLDFGYRVAPKVALTLGYRYGHQYQQQYTTDIDPLHYSSSSDYQRVLFGVEGKPCSWLSISVQLGPDFRDYEPNSPTHTSPVSDLHPVKYYGEASVEATISPRDVLSFKSRQWQWVSSLGKLPYYDNALDLNYRHKFNQRFSVDVGGRLQAADYTCGNAATSQRDDWQYTVAAGCAYAFTANLTATGSYTLDLGRNAQDNLPSSAVIGREYNRQVCFLGLQFKL